LRFKKLNKDTVLHYGSMVLGAAVLSFGLFNIHSQSQITEGGILGLTLFLNHWTGISPGVFSFILDLTCYAVGWKLLGSAFLKNAFFSTCCYALLYRLWEFTGPVLPSLAFPRILFHRFHGVDALAKLYPGKKNSVLTHHRISVVGGHRPYRWKNRRQKRYRWIL